MQSLNKTLQELMRGQNIANNIPTNDEASLCG